MLILSLFFGAFGLYLISKSIFSMIWGRVSAINMSLLGFGLFGFLDATKYYVFERYLRGDFGDEQFVNVLIYIVASFLAFLFGYCLKLSGSRNKNEEFIASSTGTRNVIFTIPLVLMANLLPLGSAFGSLVNVASIGFIFAVVAFGVSYRKYILVLLSLVAICLLLLSFGYTSRRVFIAIAIPLFVLLISHVQELKKLIRTTWRVALVAGSAVFFFFLNYLRAGHDYGDGYVEGDRLANTINYIVTLRSIDTFWNTTFIITNFPRNFNYYFGETYAAVVVALIPRSFWSDKPVSLSSLLGIMQRFNIQEDFNPYTWADANYYSLSPGLVGEAFANFGPLGAVFIPLFVGIAARHIDRLMKTDCQPVRLRLSVFLPFFFLIHRGDAYTASIYSIYLYAGAYIGFYLLTRSRSPRLGSDPLPIRNSVDSG